MVGVPLNTTTSSSQQNKPTGGTVQQTKTRRYKKPQNAVGLLSDVPDREEVEAPKVVDQGNEKAYENPLGNRRWRENYGENILTGGLDNFSNFNMQLGSNIVSGVVQLPGDIAGLVDLVRVGSGAAVNAIEDDPGQDDNYWSRLGQEFSNGVISPVGQQELQDDVMSKVNEFVTANPLADDTMIDNYVKSYMDTDEFFDLTTTKMSPGFRIAAQGNKWGNIIGGLGKRPDQQTMTDEVMQIIGQSAVSLPSSVVDGVMSAARKRLGSAVVDNAGTKAALRVAELASPITYPATPLNVGANAAVGTAITEATRVATNAPSILNGGIAEFTPEEIEEVPELASLDPADADTLPEPFIEEADGHGTNVNGQIDEGILAAGGVTLGAFFGLPAFRKHIATQAANKAKRAIEQQGLNGGRTLAEQSSKMDPILSPVAGAVDAQAPIRRGANQFDLNAQSKQYVSKGQMIDAIDAHLSTASPPNIVDSVVNIVNHGTISNSPDTIPLVQIVNAKNALKKPQQELLAKYGIAKQRQQDRRIQSQTMRQQARQLNMELQAAQARGDKRAITDITKKQGDLATRLQNLASDDPASRNMMEDWSKSEVDEIIRVAEADPELMKVANMQRTSGHDMLNYQVRNGYISSEEATIQASNRDFWFPVRERSHPDADGLKRKALLFRDRVFPRGKKDNDYYTVDATRNLDERVGGKVNRPKEPIVALQEAWSDVVRSVTANNARRNVIDTLRMFDGAEGKMFKQFEYNGRRSFSPDEFFNPATGLRQAVESNNFTRVIRDGRFEFYEWSDESMKHAMEFAPMATVPIVNSMRKAWQNFTTGAFAPWFAVKALSWDVAVAGTTMRNGRSLGLLDTYARRLANESRVVNAVMDQVPDPTRVVSVVARIPYALSMRAVRALGGKIADDLALNNGLFNMIAQVPGGKRYMSDMSTGMVKMFDRSVFNVYNRNLSTSMGLLQENTRILDDYNSQAGRVNVLGENARNVWRGYKAIVESVQGATRLAFFSENYARLAAKHGGTVPKGELAALVKDTRDLTGDLSKYSGNKLAQGATSAIPYLNPAIQGTRHIFGAMLPPSGAKLINKVTGGKANLVEERSNRFWMQFGGGIVLPAIAANTALSDWQGALEYWENNVPEWRQLTGIPIPSAEAVATRLETGAWPEFSPEMLTVLEVPPELSMLLNPVMSGLRAMGLVNNERRVPKNFGDDLKAAFQSITSFATPPVVNLFGALTGNQINLSEGTIQERNTLTFGGANADMRTFNSDMSQQMYDVIGALSSTAGQLFAQTFDVFDMSMEENNDFGTAIDDAFDTFKYETTRRFPDIPGVWNTPNKEYAFTPESEYVFNTERQLEPIIGSGRQMSVETDSKDRAESMAEQGLEPPAKISDPILKQLSQIVYDSIRKAGPYKKASEEYSNLRADLNALEVTRVNWPDDTYHAKYNEIVGNQQRLKQVQANQLKVVLEDLQGQVGPWFEQKYGVPFSYENLSTLVRKDVGNK